MTAIKAIILSLTVAVAAAISASSGLAAADQAGSVHLKSMASRVGPKVATLVIEADEPMPYLATRPDPFTVVIELRNVISEGMSNRLPAGDKGPIAGVTVEKNNSLGLPGSRLRISLTEPLAFAVRSERNTLIVDFDRTVQATGASASAPAPVLDAMQALSKPKAAIPGPVLALGLGLSTPAPVVPAAAAALINLSQPSTAAQITTAGVQSQEPRKYTGSPINFDLQDADLVGVLMLFQEISGLNLIIDPAVQGKVTMKLGQVPWDQALDAVLKQYRLGAVVDDTIVRIAPNGMLAQEQEERRKLADAQALAGDLVTIYPQLSYATVAEMQPLVKTLLSARGSLAVDVRTNTLIVTDLQARLDNVGTLIKTLDRPQPQVEIEARIVQTSKDFARALGIQWGFSSRVAGLGSPNVLQNNGNIQGVVTLPVGNATSVLDLAVGSLGDTVNLDAQLSAMEQERQGRLLSTPRVTTQNNVEAEMTQGKQIPVTTVSNNTTTTRFVDAALKLRVTPQITASNTVILNVWLENSSADAAPAGITPSISTQRAVTKLLVNDGETTVIGGIYSSDENNTDDRTPGLGRIPILKWLFKRESISDRSSELLIFITPRIKK